MKVIKRFKVSSKNFNEEVIKWLYEVTEDNKTYYEFKAVFRPTNYTYSFKKFRRIGFINQIFEQCTEARFKGIKIGDYVLISVSSFNRKEYIESKKAIRKTNEVSSDSDSDSESEFFDITKDGLMICKTNYFSRL